MEFLEVSSVSRRLNDNWIVNNISFTQQRGQNIAIAGETGSGKSTVLKMIAGFAQPHQGQILFESERVEGPEEKLIPGHPGIAYLSQEFALPKFLRVEQVLAYASKVPHATAYGLFEICRITHLLKRRTDELSGGEQQRIALARLLVGQPKLLLLDEPFSNLDMIHKGILKSVLQDMQAELKLSCILTSHDPHDTLAWADEILVMKSGEVVQQGTPQQVYHQPENEYTAGLFGKYNVLMEALATTLLNIFITSNEKLIVRPERFILTNAGTGKLDAQIQRILFCGNYYELEIQVADQVVTAQTNKANYKKGDTVGISLSSL